MDIEKMDRMAILSAKNRRGLATREEQKELVQYCASIDRTNITYDHLKHINELIWWCMDAQREYVRPTEDLSYIGMITAVLNDVRDQIKGSVKIYAAKETSE